MRLQANSQHLVGSQIICAVEEFRALLPEWTELYSLCSGSTPFQHPQWLMSWIDAFQPARLVGIEIRERDRLIGFAPLLVYPHNGRRTLAFAGGGTSDYLGLLALSEREQPVITEILRAAQTLPDWDVFDFTDIQAGNFLLHADSFPAEPQEHDLCFAFPLPANVDLVRESLTKRQWASLRNARSRTRREGEATFEVALASQATEFVHELLHLHEKRWLQLGEQGVLSDPRVGAFHLHVAPELAAAGLLRLYRMRLEDRTIAVIYCFFHLRTAYCYLQGFDPEFSYLSPGTQLMVAVIEDAVRHGLSKFDFLRGTEAYKLHWRPTGEPTYRIEIPRRLLADALPIAV